jgi:geranylgeranyl diphosphate synthase type II
LVELSSFLMKRRVLVDLALDRILRAGNGPAGTLASAMRYAVFGGGKRLRPILALAVFEACGGTDDAVLDPAAALEMIHTYSLVHDDLPAMDDDDLRRGRATTHRVYGDAVAILAGDALQSLAFEILASRPAYDAPSRRHAEAVLAVARGVGVCGMVGGQLADLEAEKRAVDGERLTWIHRHKTGALIAASALVGAIHAGAGSDRRAAVLRYGEAIGLAFQVVDDLLDRTATADQLGKTPDKDRDRGKATFPGIFGMEASRQRARELVDQGLSALSSCDLLTPELRGLAEHAIGRTS